MSNQPTPSKPSDSKQGSGKGSSVQRLVRGVVDLPAPKFMVRMIYRGMAKDCDKLATRLASFGQTDEARQARAWATAYRTTADEI